VIYTLAGAQILPRSISNSKTSSVHIFSFDLNSNFMDVNKKVNRMNKADPNLQHNRSIYCEYAIDQFEYGNEVYTYEYYKPSRHIEFTPKVSMLNFKTGGENI